MQPSLGVWRSIGMRGLLSIAGALLLTQSSASASLAQGILVCRIYSVDTVSMNFVCRADLFAQRYWVGSATQFLTPGPRGSFFDLQTGQRVQVVSHPSGRLEIADRVVS